MRKNTLPVDSQMMPRTAENQARRLLYFSRKSALPRSWQICVENPRAWLASNALWVPPHQLSRLKR
jgi:hypothetical protein